jgi:hypothetical protein
MGCSLDSSEPVKHTDGLSPPKLQAQRFQAHWEGRGLLTAKSLEKKLIKLIKSCQGVCFGVTTSCFRDIIVGVCGDRQGSPGFGAVRRDCRHPSKKEIDFLNMVRDSCNRGIFSAMMTQP